VTGLRVDIDASLRESRIWNLLSGAGDLLRQIAPERNAHIDDELQGVSLLLRDSDEVLAAGHTARREIILTRATAESLWLAAIAFVSVADIVDEQLQAGQRTISFDFLNDGRATDLPAKNWTSMT
jgi:hypothetical protein